MLPFGRLVGVNSSGFVEGERRYYNGRYSEFLKSDKRVNSQHTRARDQVPNTLCIQCCKVEKHTTSFKLETSNPSSAVVA